ncbi:permease [Conexibacter sp. SYSU D00693]|uniref:permease n=1 Tax=Conexibacter sp. SYSU D00693 TaxID=2812560 RepID=UPI00196A5B2E|nr:permease [Conexibacter sp. SYSU D00693]
MLSRRSSAVGLLAVVGLAVGLLWWSKWAPYADRTAVIDDTGAYPGSALVDLTRDGAASLSAAWAFTTTYAEAVWKALLAALLLASAVEAFLPRERLVRALSPRGTTTDTVAGGLCSLPTMMCSCCAAPLVRAARQGGASLGGTLAFWVGNPLLNPAVLVFLALLAPWQWTVTRLVMGLVVVVGLTALVARLAGPRAAPPPTTAPPPPAQPWSLATAPGRFARALTRNTLTLVPEYLLLVFAVGLLRGWLPPLDDATLAVVLAAAVLGTLVVLPTAGEIPILLALAAADAAPATLGALLITLPALSLPSMVMVARPLGTRATAAMGGAVALAGLASAGMLAALS